MPERAGVGVSQKMTNDDMMTGGVDKKVTKETLLKLSMMIFWWWWGWGTNQKKITLCVWCYGFKRNSRVVQGCKGPLTMVKKPTYAVFREDSIGVSYTHQGGW